MNLPQDFVTYTQKLFGPERWKHYLNAFNEPTPVSIRLNPFKPLNSNYSPLTFNPVPWCRNAFYLKNRPNFTLDPLLHAGAYYVQEASSMFLDHVLCSLSFQWKGVDKFCLDLCAAPGGKSTLLRSALPDNVTLYSNETDRTRANILMENMQKQGHPNVIVTNNYPKDYCDEGLLFDLILADVPCSGEGMFRKDSATIKEWSPQSVMKCQDLQRSIIEDIWPCLKDDGILIYSTCTFNTHENEDNIQWIINHLGATSVPITTKPEWNIIGSLTTQPFNHSVNSVEFNNPIFSFRFIPGTTQGEGLFMSVLRKKSTATTIKKNHNKKLRILSDGHYEGVAKGKDIIPEHAEALLYNLDRNKYPMIELSLENARRYLHREALILPEDAPRGFIIVSYKNLPLGFVKNIGTRANNLYPKEWKIRCL